MFHRESGYYKTSYAADQALYPLPISKFAIIALVVIFYIVAPIVVGDRYITLLNLVGIAIVGALGLNILLGLTGQISIGHAAFMSVGAYTAANLSVNLGMPFWVTIPAGGLMAAFIGVIFGFPSVRIKGLYLAISTLAAQFIIDWIIIHTPSISGGFAASIQVDRPWVFGEQLDTQRELYFMILVVATIAIIASLNIGRSRIGRAFIAIRDQDIAAEIIGINVRRYKLTAFAISSFYAGIAGTLFVYYSGVANNEFFPLVVSIDYLAMIIIGGAGSVLGAIFGAIFVTILPIGIDQVMTTIGPLFTDDIGSLAGLKSHLRLVIFGGLIMFFLVVEPDGLNKLWLNIRNYFRVWPFSY